MKLHMFSPVKAFSYVLDTVQAARSIAKEGHPDRGEVLRSYLRLRAQVLLRRQRSTTRPNRERIMGYEIELGDHDEMILLFWEIFRRRDYEFHCDTQSPLIVDCGSNIGMSVLYFKRLYPHSRIVAFEPGRETFRLLENNVSRNHLKDVQLHNLAVGKRAGEVDFYWDPENPTSAQMKVGPGHNLEHSHRATSVRLSDYIREPVDFLKLDVEGAEFDVLAELAESGRLGWIRQMVIEYHHHIQPSEEAFSVLLRILEENNLGYQIRVTPCPGIAPGQYQTVLLYAYQKNR